ncbi:MAG: hypothetical protein CMF74_12220 [Maricaulis sp.]|nr:hypothetical protein [Maricaulis sp.]
MKQKTIEYNIRLQQIRIEESNLRAERKAIIEHFEKVLSSKNKGCWKDVELVKKTTHVKEYVVNAHDRVSYSLLNK